MEEEKDRRNSSLGGCCYYDNILEKRIKRLENTIENQEKYIKALEKF